MPEQECAYHAIINGYNAYTVPRLSLSLSLLNFLFEELARCLVSQEVYPR